MNDPDFDWSLTAELTELCSKVFDHILKHNYKIGSELK